jgi:hypothetical protein
VVDIEDVLSRRGQKYGEYRDLSDMLDRILHVYGSSENWKRIPSYMRVSLIMDAMKTVRILNGDFREIDSWADKIGYTQLVIRELQGERNDEQSTSKHCGADRED